MNFFFARATDMKWDDLRIFMHTAEAGTYTKAATVLNIDRTTVARRIELLESELKSKLFLTPESQLVLTTNGIIVLKYAMLVNNNISDLYEELKLKNTFNDEKIRFSISKGLGSIFTKEIIEFNEYYPEIKLEVVISDDPEKEVLDKFSDVGLLERYQKPKSVEADFISNLEANFYYGKNSNVSVDNMPILNWHDNPPEYFSKWIKENFPGRKNNSIYANDLDTIKNIGLEGNVIIPIWKNIGDKDDRLQRCILKKSNIIPLWIIQSKSLPLTKSQREFIRYISKNISKNISQDDI